MDAYVPRAQPARLALFVARGAALAVPAGHNVQPDALASA